MDLAIEVEESLSRFCNEYDRVVRALERMSSWFPPFSHTDPGLLIPPYGPKGI